MPPPQRSDRRSESVKDQRTPYQRDRDRILYSAAFRRLGGVTQVVSANEALVFHNRLTHSLKVAQVARRIAEHLSHDANVLDEQGENASQIINPDVVEAAALAHDLGHPPFGHVAEKTLEQLISKDGYEGNAQSFRVITRLASHRQQYQGLNLTRATLNATLKYPWLRAAAGKESDKFGAYQADIEAYDFARDGSKSKKKCIEAQIMDWADDITYALHDMEDFFHSGLIPLVRLASKDDDERENFFAGAKKRLNISDFTQHEHVFENLASMIPVDSSTRGRTRSFDALKPMTAALVGIYLQATEIAVDPAGGLELKIDERVKMEVQLLKELTWQYVILSPELATQQHGYRKIIKELYITYKEAISEGNMAMVPRWFPIDWKWVEGNEQNCARCAADLVSSLTDQQAMVYYSRLMGIAPGSVVGWT